MEFTVRSSQLAVDGLQFTVRQEPNAPFPSKSHQSHRSHQSHPIVQPLTTDRQANHVEETSA
jgi:hypothetical protein